MEMTANANISTLDTPCDTQIFNLHLQKRRQTPLPSPTRFICQPPNTKVISHGLQLGRELNIVHNLLVLLTENTLHNNSLQHLTILAKFSFFFGKLAKHARTKWMCNAALGIALLTGRINLSQLTHTAFYSTLTVEPRSIVVQLSYEFI